MACMLCVSVEYILILPRSLKCPACIGSPGDLNRCIQTKKCILWGIELYVYTCLQDIGGERWKGRFCAQTNSAPPFEDITQRQHFSLGALQSGFPTEIPDSVVVSVRDSEVGVQIPAWTENYFKICVPLANIVNLSKESAQRPHTVNDKKSTSRDLPSYSVANKMQFSTLHKQWWLLQKKNWLLQKKNLFYTLCMPCTRAVTI